MFKFYMVVKPPTIGTTLEMVDSALRVIVNDGSASDAYVVAPVVYVPVSTKKLFSWTAFIAEDPM